VCICVCVCVCVVVVVVVLILLFISIAKFAVEFTLLNHFIFIVKFLFFFKTYLFIIYEYTVTVFRHTRRGHQMSLQMVVSHHVVAGI